MSERRRCAYRDCDRRVPRPGALYCSASHRELASRDRRMLRSTIATARVVIRQLAKDLERAAQLAGEHQRSSSGDRARGGKRSIYDVSSSAAAGAARLTPGQGSKDTGPRRRGRPGASQRLVSVERLSGPSSASSARAEFAQVARDASALPAPLRAVVDQVLEQPFAQLEALRQAARTADFPGGGSMIWPDPE
jgi:hypothetical protein